MWAYLWAFVIAVMVVMLAVFLSGWRYDQVLQRRYEKEAHREKERRRKEVANRDV